MNDMKSAFQKAGYKMAGGQEAKTASHQISSQAFTQEGTSRQEGASTQEGTSLPCDYTARAEQVIIGLRQTLGKNYNDFTTTKIRNILSMVNEIYNEVRMKTEDTLSLDIQNQIKYLKVRLVYECGREPKIIKPFVQSAGLLEIISDIGDSRNKFIEFARYMEALVAYHRFYGGKDQ